VDAARPWSPEPGEPSGKSVAIVGAGPAGLSAAFYLRRRGHACTLYDAHPRPGGMLRYGIPEYRLPRAALDEEIRVIERLGAEFRMNTRLGRDVSLAGLRQEHDAVFLAIGAQRSSSLRCEGQELALSGLEYLDRLGQGQAPGLGPRVIVVGGGNTAMDAARCALRGEAEVQVFYRRSRTEMPCLLEEVTGAEEEGVRFEFLVAPLRLERRAGGEGLTLVCRRMTLGPPDDSGRRRPVPIGGSEFATECDTVIAAVGQAVDLALAEREGVPVTAWGLGADPRTMQTALPGVFCGGDAVLGADLAVRAVAAGRAAAVSIDQLLSGQTVSGPEEVSAIAMRPVDDLERAAIYREIEKTERVATERLGLERRRSSFDEIDFGLGDEQARREAVRCMSCNCRKSCDCSLRTYGTEYGIDPYRFQGDRRRFDADLSHPEIVYEPGKCIMCDACVRIAREAGEELGVSIVGRGFDVRVAVPFDRPLSEGLRQVARRCAEACPTGALALRSARSCDLDPPSGFPLEIT
jgi:formate dehydrogenase major subunit